MAKHKESNTKPGEMLLRSICSVFDQAKYKGFTSDDDFVHLKVQILMFLIECDSMTGATARAKCPIKFPDNTWPHGKLALPPSDFKLGHTGAARLREAMTARDFQNELRMMIEDQLDPEAARLRGKKRKAAKRPPEAEAETNVKRKKITVLIRSSRRNASPSTNTTQAEPDGAAENGAAKETSDTAAPGIPANDDQTPTLGAVKVVAKSKEEPANPPPLFVQSAPPAAETGDLDVSKDHEIKSEEPHSTDPLENAKSGEQEDTAMVDIGAPAQLQPVLAANLAEQAPDRLSGALAGLQKEISRIPAENWDAYKKQLDRFAINSEARAINYIQRLLGIVEIIYLPEELDVMCNRDWDRLEDVVQICALLAEVTGPVDEEMNRKLVDKWVKSKFQDIAWLKTVLGAKKKPETSQSGEPKAVC